MTVLQRLTPRMANRAALFAGGAALLLASCQSVPPGPSPAAGESWVATWASSPSLPMGGNSAPRGMRAPVLEGTVRYFLRVSAGGNKARIVLDGGPSIDRVSIGAATIALADGNSIDTSTLRTLTFSGEKDFSLHSQGAPLWSDPVDIDIPTGAVLAVSLFLREPVQVPQADPQLITRMQANDDLTSSSTFPDARTFVARPLLAAVHTANTDIDHVIVAFGDSITDGMGSRDPLMRGWPDYLAARMRDEGMDNVAIVNHGIGGNRLLQDTVGESALARFDGDVIAMPGVTDVIILEGINDIGVSGLIMPGRTEPYPPLTADDVIAAYVQLIERAHAHGIRVIGATLTPDLGSPFPGYATEEKDVIRNEVNHWIRNSGEFDAVIDFDAAVRDSQNPKYLADAFNSGDAIHPSDAGYKAMAKTIDLDLFR